MVCRARIEGREEMIKTDMKHKGALLAASRLAKVTRLGCTVEKDEGQQNCGFLVP